jgi:hypothetical protein
MSASFVAGNLYSPDPTKCGPLLVESGAFKAISAGDNRHSNIQIKFNISFFKTVSHELKYKCGGSLGAGKYITIFVLHNIESLKEVAHA